ncbi:mucin-5AC-like isoform X16 [Penaeus japonicus]|uniref:mucin-5AC-like isoform X16 n=1 Tax=Penaeus japonicus TaxID=27405 RepID=UPI001C710FA7|nr:mucin-5AC-like isoform X16 [Penaeus japonicus]
MTTLCSTPESLPSPRAADAAPPGFQAPSDPSPRPYDAPGFPSGASAASYSARSDSDYEVPFFTVAHYRSPTAPTTYEYAATHTGFPEGAGEALYNGGLDTEAMSPVELAFGGSVGESGRWWPRDGPEAPLEPTPPQQPARSPVSAAPPPGRSEPDCALPAHPPGAFIRRVYGSHDRTPVGCLHAAAGTAPRGQKPPTPGTKPAPPETPPRPSSRPARSHDDTPVRGSVDFRLEQPSRTPSRSRSGSRRRASSPGRRTTPTTPTSSFPPEMSQSTPLIPRDTGQGAGDSVPGVAQAQDAASRQTSFSGSGGRGGSGGGREEPATSLSGAPMDGSGVYEDAGVSDAADRLESALHSSSSSEVMVTPRTPRTPRTSRSKSREPSFCLELEDDEYPRTETEYMSLLNAKIAEAHERQLLPLKEDLADWLSKLLGVEDLTAENLIEKLDNGVYVCRLAEVISRRARDARDKGTSTLEVPCLPYRTWERARSGTFFARDNISNFLRFCRRLGVHDNLLFETEDLVCHSGARGVVLCLLEVGRLAQGWWGLEPPGIVKLEREMDGEEWSGRSDSGYSNTSSPRGSTLTLHPAAPSPPAADSKLPRGWSGAKTTPTTPVTTPTHSAKPRLPSARTPRSSGRSTPNTTPTTPTHCRRYMTSLQRTPATPSKPSRPTSRPSSKPPSRSPSICSRLQECYNTVQPDSVTEALRTDLDNKVFDIANQTRGFCGCKDTECTKSHVKRVSDGKYEICGRNVFVRLLKGKHVMVRVGGGWDTLEHYLLRHDPKQVTVFNLKSADPFLHIRAKYCSPTHSRASSSRGSPTHSQATPSRGTASGDPTPGNTSSEGTPPPPQVPPSLPAESSMPAEESCRFSAENSNCMAERSVPAAEDSAITTEQSKPTAEGPLSAMQTSFSKVNGEDSDEHHVNGTMESQSRELQGEELSAEWTGESYSPTPERSMVNSSTFCVEDKNVADPIPTISLVTHSKSMSVSSTSSTSSASDSSCSLKVTPPPTPSTFSTPACATSNELSVTPDGSSTTMGTPLPPDFIEQDEL